MIPGHAEPRPDADKREAFWVFGYGSLIHRPAFPFVRRARGAVEGWVRRFWQGSPDHRGTPERPGRVVNVVEAPSARLWGVAYQVADEHVEQVIAALDHREQGGYERRAVAVALAEGAADEVVSAWMYLATADNPCFLGPAPLDEMARHILRSEGPSGRNVDYVLALAGALRDLHVRDDETYALEAALLGMMGPDAPR